MNAGVARLIMAMAVRSFPQGDREWKQAMRAEFEVALLDGRPLGFALGCLVAGCRRLPFHSDGRFALASHGLALGLLVPIATFHLGCAVSSARLMLTGHDHYHAMLMAAGQGGRELAASYLVAAPTFGILLMLLGSAHLLIAWMVLDERWLCAAVLWLGGAIVAAAVIVMAIATIPGAGGSGIQVAALVIELVALPPLALWRSTGSGSRFPMEIP